MPAIIPIIFEALGAIGVISATTAAVLAVVSALAVGIYETNRAKHKARDAYNKSLQDRIFTVRSGVAPRTYVIGKLRVGGVLVYADALGTNKSAFDEVIALCANRSQLIAYYVGDEYIAVADFPGPKFGRVEQLDVREEHNVTVVGGSVTINLNATPVPGTTVLFAIRGARSWGNPQTITPVGSQITVTGLPNGSIFVSCSYKQGNQQKLRATFYPGSNTQTIAAWPDFASPQWTSAHRLQGTSCLRTLMIWDENIWQQGAPLVGGVIIGHDVESHLFYDPRTGLNPVTTDNPALVWAWWRTLSRSLGGMGIPSDWINWQDVAIAANICDELISVRTLDGTGYESVKRYQCNCLLSLDATGAENEQIILSAMAGRRVFTAGKYRVMAGAFRPASIVLTDKDIIGKKPITVVTADPNSVPPNVVTARFADATAHWHESNPKPVENAAYLASDGHEERLDLTLPATTDPRQANYLMGIALESARPAFSVTLSVSGVGEDLAIFDTVQLNLTNRAAYAGRTFEIVSLIDQWDGTFDLVLAELKATTFALDPNTWTPVNPPSVPDNSYLWDIPAITGFHVVAQTPTTLPDGTAVTRIDLTWDPPPTAYIAQGGRIELRYKPLDGDWISVAPLPGDATATTITAAIVDLELYQFQVRAVSAIGAAGPWADFFTNIEGTPIPGVRAIKLRASSLIYHITADGSTIDPSSISLTLERQGGLVNAATWETTPAGITLGGSGDNRTLAYTNIPGNVSTVRIDVEVDEDSVLYLDQVTVVKLRDGSDSAGYTPDLTAPPTPAGLAATAAFANIILTWTAPTFTVGHGYDSTVVYAAKVTGPPVTFANAAPVGTSAAPVFSHNVGMGETWAYWIKHKTADGVQSVTPAGGTNGVQATTGKIGTTDLGPLIVDAAALASGAVTALKIADSVIAATKFAAGIEPITNVATVPATLVTRTIFNTTDTKLYRWNGSAYVATVLTADLSGQLTNAQIAALDAAKLTGQITSTQIADGAISTPKLAAGSVTAAQIAADTITAAQIAANAITASELAAGAVTTAKLTAGAVTANELAANSIVAGKIAAAAINAVAIAAGAITADKVLITGRGAALNDDPAAVDPSAWILYDNGGGGSFQTAVSSSIAPAGTVLRLTGPIGVITRTFPIIPGKRYRVSAWARQVSGNGVFYLRLFERDNVDTLLAFNIGIEAITITGSFVRYAGTIDVPVSAVKAQINVYGNWTGTGVTDVADIRCEEVLPGELIVDGAITATKLAANSIAVGTAAIQNGAIVNAMIGSLAVDDAKIASLSGSKIVAGSILAASIAAGTITADRLAVLTSGGTTIDMSSGRITWTNGAFMKVSGVGFGSANQFIEWFGPVMSIAACSEANAISYLKTNGSAYFGGSLSAGTLKTAGGTSDLSAAATATIGPFGSNGNTINVVIAYNLTTFGTLASGNPQNQSFPISATVSIFRTIGTGSEVLVDTLNVTGACVHGPNVPSEGVDFSQSMAGSRTWIDTLGGSSTRTYRATITARSVHHAPGGQNISIVATEG